MLSLVALVALARGIGGGHPPPRPAYVTPPALHGPVDINSATASELVALPRIGPALAERIVDDRESRGPFTSIDALDRVPGIGPRTIELLRPYAIVAHERGRPQVTDR